MMVSPPGSPEGIRRPRPQSMYSATSPDMGSRSRPQSMMHKPVRSDSRMSASSKYGVGSRSSDDDGKTSVRVAVRVRPPLQPSDPGYELIPQRFQRSTVHVTTNTSLGVDSPLGRKLFIFDRVFDQDVTQLGVWEYLQDSVDSFLQGYNVSILAYGQSGAGKSYTMGTSGPSEHGDASSRGVIPRAAAHLFDNLTGSSSSHNRQHSGLKTPTRYSVGNISNLIHNVMTVGATRSSDDRDWQLSATYVEIYNEQPRDLLLPETTPASERATVMIREDAKGRIYVEGLRSVPITNIDELLAVLHHGSAIRQTDATAINAKSSRSHAVFTLNLRQMKSCNFTTTPNGKRSSVPVDLLTNGDSSITVESKLHFVDLAGSERLKNTGATGDRAKEGISINAGLASLGKVISQLSSRSAGSHVSYRDSKLTRMLQDSLGGNAITYMIACVTPAEFHLSETLNTVQYAQRARNIQSKPKIQQVSDEGDKQATIDRLRTEVAFLRQQIRSAGDGERRTGALSERSDRPNERENELQNQLLDVQESYTTLSQRHARLVSELTKSGVTDDPSQNHLLNHSGGESAMDRLKRSQANQEQIEQVVLEYEKTIQSLEANLSNTRSSLANTESSLLERETKCAYVETVNQQLHSRLQKLMDRESSTETYVRSLESKVDGQTSGEDKNNATIADLRKELARIRESEVNAEDYISTLEERLAEADQDMELMQREVERLEHVVERQRSLGKLDNLLYELDHIQRHENPPNPALQEPPLALKSSKVDGIEETSKPLHKDEENDAALIALPEETEDEIRHFNSDDVIDVPHESNDLGLADLQKTSTPAQPAQRASELVPETRDQSLQSPAQSRFVAEKFESVSQELFDLRLEHESTVNELDLMSAKYQEALNTLAEMQDAVDEARHQSTYEPNSPGYGSRPESFLADARINELKNGGHLSSSRSLSSELSLAGESPVSTDASEITPVSKKVTSTEVAYQEIDRLQHLLTEHERSMNLVTQQYAQLQVEHQDTLSTVETLKSEIQSGREKGMSSPIFPGTIRRISSHAAGATDRGHRSVMSLRTIMSEEFENKPDRFESAELHLNSASQELQMRTERIQALESELKNVKKDMEMKTTIIAGLTRERNSLKVSSPVDLSMVSQMRDQLIQKETELKTLHEGYARREEELQREIHTLSQAKTKHEVVATTDKNANLETDEKYNILQSRFDQLLNEHVSLEQSHHESESKLRNTISELEAALASIETLKAQYVSNEDDSVFERAATATAMQKERDHYQELVTNLKQDLDEHRALNDTHLEKINELEKQHDAAQNLINQHSQEIENTQKEIMAHRDTIAQLESDKAEAESAVEFHKHGLKSLHETHANTIEEMKLVYAGQMAEIDEQLAALSSKNEAAVNAHKVEAARYKAELDGILAGATAVLGHPTSVNMLVNHVQDAVEERKHISETNKRLVSTNAELERQLEGRQTLIEIEQELEAANLKMTNFKETIRNLANEVANHEETIREKNEVIRKRDAAIESLTVEKQKKNALIEELEQQLQNSFDQHHNRLSVVQAQGSQALSEAQQRIAVLEKDLDARRSFVDSETASRSNTMKSQRPHSPQADGQQRSSSLTSNLRKSNSVASLPSPPPSVPLPPLPSLPGISVAAPSSANPSPPQSRHTSKEIPTSGNSPVPPVSPMLPPPTPTSVGASNVVAARQSQHIDDLESRLRTIEKHLHAEKQLTATLEEALVDLETQSNKLRADAEVWKKKAWQAEEEVGSLKKERKSDRLSVQVMEEEKRKRAEAEAARAHLEERMRVLSETKKKKKKTAGGLNCF